MLGKLNTHEYAWGTTTDNPHYGATRNPWNRECIPGGSSGGSAAAMAAGLAAGTLGTDTAGSTRMPAALCGVVGLKPTFGRVSKAGVIPLGLNWDHVGTITRTVEDSALLLQAIAGYDPEDFTTVRLPVDDYLTRLRDGIAGVRVGIPRAHFYDLLDDEVRRAVEAALDVLQQLGARLQEVEIPGVNTLPSFQYRAEAQQFHAEAFATRPEDFGPDVAARLAEPIPSGTELAGELRRIHEVGVAFRRALEAVDVLVTPTVPLPAPRTGQRLIQLGAREERVGFMLMRCTSPFSATHLPALSIPCGFTAAGLPIGLQIAGRPFDEALVLRVGDAYEQATDWHRQRPPEPATVSPTASSDLA